MAFRDPAFAIAYGPSKYGKTTDALYSFPNAYFMAQPGALKPSVNVVGFEVPDANVGNPQDIAEARAMIPALVKRGFRATVMDDFTFLAEQTMSKLEQTYTGFKLWGKLRDEILALRHDARHAQMHVVLNCHETPPRVYNGGAQRGGPKLPGRLPEELPAACDLVVRATLPGGGLGGGDIGLIGWKTVYRCAPSDAGYISGDRHGVTPETSPMNLGEILRAAGYVIDRAPGLEWMEKAVTMLAQEFATRGPANDAAMMKIGAEWLVKEGKTNLLHVRWALRDAYHRAVIWRARQNPLAMFGVA